MSTSASRETDAGRGGGGGGGDAGPPTLPARGLTVLLRNIVDYAGLFPPATLDMAATVRNYAAYLAGPHEWMLERLVVPVARLDELEREAEALLPRDAEAEPWPISALTAPAGEDGLAADLERIERFNALHRESEGGLAVIDAIELRASAAAAIDAALDRIPDDLFPFFELPAGEDPRGLLATLVGADAGAKIRTGGMTADLYPAPADVARFIAACARANVPFKATAGLHHPLRRRNEAVGVDELGFLGVFAAAAIALHHDLEAAALLPILEEASAEAFRFDADGLAWKDERLDVDEIEDARLTFAVSFGSCSFDEPIDDLVALGLFPPSA